MNRPYPGKDEIKRAMLADVLALRMQAERLEQYAHSIDEVDEATFEAYLGNEHAGAAYAREFIRQAEQAAEVRNSNVMRIVMDAFARCQREQAVKDAEAGR